MFEFKKEVVELFCLIYTSGVYTLEFCLLDHFVKVVSRSGNISVLDISTYEQCNVHI